jgi:glyoxalase family protein
MGFREVGSENGFTRFETAKGGPGGTVDLYADPKLPRATGGAGTVHHVAFRTPDEETQLRWRGLLLGEGYAVSPVMDRNYFHSIYFREPNGILFEIATDPPGFAVDESADELGAALKLPEMYEARRSRLEKVLPPITVPTTGLVTESY